MTDSDGIAQTDRMTATRTDRLIEDKKSHALEAYILFSRLMFRRKDSLLIITIASMLVSSDKQRFPCFLHRSKLPIAHSSSLTFYQPCSYRILATCERHEINEF